MQSVKLALSVTLNDFYIMSCTWICVAYSALLTYYLLLEHSVNANISHAFNWKTVEREVGERENKKERGIVLITVTGSS